VARILRAAHFVYGAMRVASTSSGIVSAQRFKSYAVTIRTQGPSLRGLTEFMSIITSSARPYWLIKQSSNAKTDGCIS
jgi:hypothetical protein